MQQECTHDCETCSRSCAERTTDFRAKPNELSHIRKIYAVVSGKGGVGKSLVTSLLAVQLQRKGLQTAILDADVTGPSIPKAFGLREKAMGNGVGILPVKTQAGISVMSLNLLLENDTDPVIWRGPVIAGTVQQFYTDVIWDDVDVMLVDMPPGTGDVPLTVFQSLPVDGIIIVASPQELVSMIVEKAVNMADMMHIPIVGLVENMSYFQCPDCGKQHALFGNSHIEEIAQRHGISTVCKLPIQPALATAVDAGQIEQVQQDALFPLVELLSKEENA